MGSVSWDNQCYLKYHNGRPLSVALTEPFETEIAPYIETDFALYNHPRSHSSGRIHKREYYSTYHHPNIQYVPCYCSPPLPRRLMNCRSSRDVFVEKLVTIEGEQYRPAHNVITYVRTPSPPVRQIKIRSRPSSCFDLHKKETTDNQWSKYVDERHEEHYQYHYNYTLPFDRTVPIQREASPPPKPICYDATTATDDLYIPIAPKPATKNASTTANLPRRPLSISETQIIERYEKDEKIRGDPIIETSSMTTTSFSRDRPLQYIYDNYDFADEQSVQASKKTQHKDFVQRIYARNGTTSKSSNSLNLYSNFGNNQTVIRPTSKPREALVDTPGITSYPGGSSGSITTTNFEVNSKSRNYYQST